MTRQMISISIGAELLRLLVMIGVGILCLEAGMIASARSQKLATAIAGFSALLAALMAAAHYPPLRDAVGPFTSRLGGEGAIACLMLLLLIGTAWNAEGAKSRRSLLTMAAGLGFVILLVFVAAPLGWRTFGQGMRRNYPDTAGLIQQKTGMTCAPASATMLLHRYGINISEGQLAELAGTNPLIGTDEFALARALEYVAHHKQLLAFARRLRYEEAQRLASPFVAYVRRPNLGGHAILVLKVDQNGVETADPLSGTTEQMDRASFEAEWSGVAIWMERKP